MNAADSRWGGQDWNELILAAADALEAHVDELSQLDALVGDGDHGVNVTAAMRSIRKTLSTTENPLPGEVLMITGDGFLNEMGGAAGALFGSLFRAMGRSFGDVSETTVDHLIAALDKGVAVVMRRGRTRPGDKTMVDALAAAVVEAADIDATAVPLSDAMALMAKAARRGAEATTSMVASRGRAKYAADMAVGVQDPGATTVAVILEAWAATAIEGSIE